MIDLHSHSSASDGALSPANSARHAISLRLSAWALTDHDTTDGLSEAAKTVAAEGGSMEFVPGIELNIRWPSGEFHLLGLGLRRLSPELAAVTGYLADDRRRRNEEILAKMREATGIGISLPEMEEKFGTRQIGRPHFARLLAEMGVVRRPQEAFDRFLGSGRPWYAPHAGEDLDVAVEAIRTSGGVPVIAHPKSLYVSLSKIEPLLADFRSRGVAGLEAWHPCVREAEARRLEEMARRLGMFVTAGSDFHGRGVRADRRLGETAGGNRIDGRFWTDELLPALGGGWSWRETEWARES